MNCDMTFCEGYGCKRREECHRYLESLRFRADKTNLKNYISMYKPTDPSKCTLFWREKGGENE